MKTYQITESDIDSLIKFIRDAKIPNDKDISPLIKEDVIIGAVTAILKNSPDKSSVISYGYEGVKWGKIPTYRFVTSYKDDLPDDAIPTGWRLLNKREPYQYGDLAYAKGEGTPWDWMSVHDYCIDPKPKYVIRKIDVSL